jgi:hypothetical protein
MFHSDGANEKTKAKNVHPTLALAFLVKKRGEYATSLGTLEKSKSAGKRSEASLFLPSTKEIMEWKGQ